MSTLSPITNQAGTSVETASATKVTGEMIIAQFSASFFEKAKDFSATAVAVNHTPTTVHDSDLKLKMDSIVTEFLTAAFAKIPAVATEDQSDFGFEILEMGDADEEWFLVDDCAQE